MLLDLFRKSEIDFDCFVSWSFSHETKYFIRALEAEIKRELEDHLSFEDPDTLQRDFFTSQGKIIGLRQVINSIKDIRNTQEQN